MKIGVLTQMGDVFQLAGGEVIDDIDLVSPGQESFSQVGTDEAGSAGNEIFLSYDKSPLSC